MAENMAENKQKGFEKLQRLFNLMDDDALTKEQFIDAFKKVIDYVKRVEEQNFVQFKEIKRELEKAHKELQNATESDFGTKKAQLDAELRSLLERFSKREGEILQKLSEVRDGIDADEDAVVDRATERVKDELFIPSTEDLLNDVPVLAERIRDALELLEGEDRLDVSAIKGIKDMLGDIDGKISKAVGAIHVPSPVGWTRHQGFSCDGGTTVFSLDQAPGHEGKAAIVRYEGQVLTETTHYTISGTDITTTFTPDNGTQIDCTYWPF